MKIVIEQSKVYLGYSHIGTTILNLTDLVGSTTGTHRIHNSLISMPKEKLIVSHSKVLSFFSKNSFIFPIKSTLLGTVLDCFFNFSLSLFIKFFKT